MARRKIEYRDILFYAINEQENERGTAITIFDTEATFFIVGIDGASNSNPVLIKNSADVVVTEFISEKEFPLAPLRINGGFKMTAPSAANIRFFRYYNN